MKCIHSAIGKQLLDEIHTGQCGVYHYRKLVKERGWQTIELNVISQRTYDKFVGLPTNIADGDFWTNLEKKVRRPR
jgi:hypothetical protein